MINERIKLLRSLMKERNIDAYLVPTSDFHESEYVGEYFKSRQYITGFTGSAGTAVITQTKAGLWTDGRYFVQAEKELKDSCIKLFKMGNEGVPSVEQFLKDCIPQNGKLGFDGRVVNTELANSISSYLKKKKVTFAVKEDLIGIIWESRPKISKEKLWLLDEKYAGISCADKIAELRKIMKDKEADVHIITTLDEIAWLLNIRGNDILCNPVFLSFVIITNEELYLFVHKEILNDKISEYLRKNNITVYPYEDIYSNVNTYRNKTILVEYKKINYSIFQSIDKTNEIIDEINPCVFKKAVKNSVEIENMKKVHIKDGIAVTKFMYWLKSNLGKIPMNEITVAKYLEDLRKSQDGYIEPSFITIAAYSDNAAMCHYRANSQKFRTIKPEGMLLVDSGGQYLEGTTDITRTFALGKLTSKEKEYFTIVSMAMLKTMDMKFLHGCRGLNLDYVIREEFWKRGLDFNHGTGHGVGYLTGCHERPNGIRWKIVPERQDSAIIEPGMICSAEPGLYISGEFGVRTENLILCIPDEKNEYGQFLRFEHLTYAPIDIDALDTNFMDDNDIRRLNKYHKAVFEKISPYLSEEENKWLKHVTRAVNK